MKSETKSDIEIAQASVKKPIREIAAAIGLSEEEIIPYGQYMAKVPIKVVEDKPDQKAGKLILITAMTPTAMGEGKTTTTIGLGQALSKIGKNTMIAIREPSLGPCMGLKGGAAGGGYSQVLPMEEINLHFTGDLHAVTAAHNLLAALVDNHLHQNNAPEMNPRQVVWKRIIDMNDRSLRNIVVGLQGGGINGVMREDGFEITAASEIMAVLCLSKDIEDLKSRLGKIIVGFDFLRKPVTVADIGAHGAMAALLKYAIQPNLVQTIEGTPVFIHGGPFANIAHGCNTLVATRMAMKLADFVVTEAGFGADLGAEKFFNIKCRSGQLKPSACVLVVTRRAYALHGIDNIKKHAESLQLFHVPTVVSINRFIDDDPEELNRIKQACLDAGLLVEITDYREKGGEGGLELAESVSALCEGTSEFSPLYDLESPISEKIDMISRQIYGAEGIELTAQAKRDIKRIENLGYGNLPICMAKTPASLTDDPAVQGRPRDFSINISSARVSAGAGFVVVYTGKVMTMPGLPKKPAALDIDIDASGNISGLF